MRDLRPVIRVTPVAAHTLNQMRLIDWLECVEDEDLRNELVAIYRHYTDLWAVVPGSSANHQAWPGGLRDHLADMCRLAWLAYTTETQMFGPLPFTFDDVVVGIFCHDAEKLVKNGPAEDPRCELYINLHHQEELSWEEVKFYLLDHWAEQFGLLLTPEQRNAVKYTHGEPEDEYRKDRRVMGELAAFVGNIDRASARIWHSRGRGMG